MKMKKNNKRDEFLKAAKGVDAVIWMVFDSHGNAWKAVTSEGVYSFDSSRKELVAKLEKENMTWVDGVL